MSLMSEWLKYLLGIAIAALLGYSATVNRISVLETKQQANEQRLERIETKIDVLLQR